MSLIEDKIKKVEEEISGLKIKKENLQKELNKIEIEKGVIENSLTTLEKELSDTFNLDVFDEEVVSVLIEKLESEIAEKEKEIDGNE
jgi:chromosome segregation ATPase